MEKSEKSCIITEFIKVCISSLSKDYWPCIGVHVDIILLWQYARFWLIFLNLRVLHFVLDPEPHRAVGNMSGNRCKSDCRSRGGEFDPNLVAYFLGDWSWNNFYGHSPPFSWIIQEGLLSVTSERMCTKYWLTAVQACPGKSVVRWTDHPAMTIAVELGRKATKQTNKTNILFWNIMLTFAFSFISDDEDLWPPQHDKKHASFTMRIQEKKSGISCPICGKPFFRRALLERHMMFTRERNHLPVIWKRFTQKGNLKAHQITHLNDSLPL